ncbi:hypothetical protein VKT23_012566 [Stygiomarasmius scandens]|uniref:Uncharacterized protein n=1 Tax=Marasmiellus scandens TaxID=2682957 RepID=A0ABR1J673_9AGAR
MPRYPTTSSSPSCTRTSASDASSSQAENGSLLKKRYGSDREIDSYPLQARSPIASRFSFYLHPDPRFWGSSVYVGVPEHEEEDFLHEARSGEDIWDRHFSLFSRRWLTNVGCLGLVAMAVMALL